MTPGQVWWLVEAKLPQDKKTAKGDYSEALTALRQAKKAEQNGQDCR